MSIDDWITTEEASQRYGKTKCAWRQACIAGRVTRAALKGGIWLIHQDAARDYAATSKRGRPRKQRSE